MLLNYVFSALGQPTAMHFAIRDGHYGPVSYLGFPEIDVARAVQCLEETTGDSWSLIPSIPATPGDQAKKNVAVITPTTPPVAGCAIDNTVPVISPSGYQFIDCGLSHSAEDIMKQAKLSNRQGMTMSLRILNMVALVF